MNEEIAYNLHVAFARRRINHRLKVKIFDKMYQEFNDLMEPAVNFEFAFNSCQFDSMNLTSETFLHPVKSLKKVYSSR